MTLRQIDCLLGLAELPAQSVDLVYLDPPFFSQKTQRGVSKSGEQFSFNDLWSSRSDYLSYIKNRLVAIKRVLKNSGSIFLHCDNSASHYLRVLMDDVFGEKQFRSEIVWSYKRWSNASRGLLPGHQTIFYYTMSSSFTFNTIYKEYSPTTNLDQILQMRERNELGKASYKKDESGAVVLANEKKGVPMSDVWEIPFLNPKARERTGYPTQKPIELLERIIKISTNEGDTVLDPFCGSGTTLVASKMLKRKYIGFDIGLDAIKIATERLNNPIKSSSNVLEVGEDAYRTKSEDEMKILNQLDCSIVQRNRGIDAFLKKHHFGAPVAVRIQKKFESIEQAVLLLSDASKRKNCSVSVLIRTDEDSGVCGIKIPDNMIVIKSYQNMIEQAIYDKMNKVPSNKGQLDLKFC